ncbi:MAG: AI-2E family transporter [Chloroflexota bacterium]|nr:AI-2E family transporter [Chloroflexota bacterium]
MHAVNPNIVNGSTTRWVLTAVLIIALLVGAWIVRGILLLTLGSVILVVLFTMPIRFLVRRGVGRRLATLISIAFIIVSVTLLLLAALPTLVQEFNTLATVIIPQGIEALIERWSSGEIQQQFPFLAGITTEDIESTVAALGRQLTSAIPQLGVQVLPVLGGVADTFLSILIVIFLSVYFLADPRMHQEGIVKLFPLGYRYRVREIIVRLDMTLRGWLRATIISMAFVLVGTWLGMTLLGIRQAAALGVLSGMLSFIPNFGPIIALVPSVAVAIVQTPENIGWVVVIIYGVSFVQSQVVTPLLVQESIQLPPVLVLLGQIIAGAFLGFLGIMLSVPITALIMVLVQEIYVKDMLGDKHPTGDSEDAEPRREALIPDRVSPSV